MSNEAHNAASRRWNKRNRAKCRIYQKRYRATEKFKARRREEIRSYRTKMVTRLELVEQEKVPCKCGHLRSEHTVCGHISDCGKGACDCMQYTPSIVREEVHSGKE